VTIISLGISGRADASSALGPVTRSPLATEKRQNKQQVKSIVPERKAYLGFGFWVPITSQYRGALCKYKHVLVILSTERKPHPLELLRVVLVAGSGVITEVH
jgi:hypothetical protein